MKLIVNLLPPTYRRKHLLRRRAMQWGAALGAVLLVVWCGRWFEMRDYDVLRRQLEAASREAQPAQVMLREITEMRKQIDELQEYEAVAQELEYQRQVLPVLGIVSHSAKFSDGKLQVTQLLAEEFQSLATPESTTAARDEKSLAGSVKLVGVALDNPAVAEFQERLVKSGMFTDVRLIKSNERKNGVVALCDYEVSCEL